jgi:hypothetical protein
MRFLAGLLFALVVTACARQPEPDLNPMAEQYVRLSLEMGAHEEGYIDSYFGQPEWKTEAEAHPRSIADLKTAADALNAQIETAEHQAHDPVVKRRAHTLAAYVSSARFRLDMMEGTRVPFVEEAQRLFALTPELTPLEHYDAVLARLDQMFPGHGSLADRIGAVSERFIVAPEYREAVMRAAIAECRRRTLAHIPLPQNERFEMEFVTHQPWGAYNWYRGDNHSLIQVNTDLPFRIDSAVGYGCHEGYPGHHVQGIYAEKLYRQNGWVEYSIMPLYSPQGPLNEGGGNYGEELAFPGNERLEFERTTLFPLAHLDPASAEINNNLRNAVEELQGAARTIEAQYLDGAITRDRAIELLEHYALSSPERAAKALEFADHYRSYIINYTSGLDVVRNFANRGNADQDTRWARYRSILEQPTLPSDLQQ